MSHNRRYPPIYRVVVIDKDDSDDEDEDEKRNRSRTDETLKSAGTAGTVTSSCLIR